MAIEKIGIQGINGSNHDAVAQLLFGKSAEVVGYNSFDALVQGLMNAKCDTAIMALENSIVGSILSNYTLIDRFNLHIIDEFYLNINHTLMALPGQKLSELTEVRSHPMALAQCKEFLVQQTHLKLVESSDTALVAQEIQTQQLKGVAAIAPKNAAELFNLEVVKDHIQSDVLNQTRFVIVKSNQSKTFAKEPTKINKASIKFSLNHTQGSLASILVFMNDHQLNLTKIQSLPMSGNPWKYYFFVDLIFEQSLNYYNAISHLKLITDDFKVLGEYKNQQA